jgi:hypothetical protein
VAIDYSDVVYLGTQQSSNLQKNSFTPGENTTQKNTIREY